MRFDIFESYARDNHIKATNNIASYRLKDGLASLVSMFFSQDGLKIKQMEFPEVIKCSNSENITVDFSDIDFDISKIRNISEVDSSKIFSSIFKKLQESKNETAFINIKFLNIRDSLIFLNMFLDKYDLVNKKMTICPVRRLIKKSKLNSFHKSYIKNITTGQEKYTNLNKINYKILSDKSSALGIEFLMRDIDTKLNFIETFYVKTNKKIYNKSKLFIVNSDNQLTVESISDISVIRNTISKEKFYMINVLNLGDFVINKREQVLDKITFSESAIKVDGESPERAKSLSLLNEYLIKRFYGGSVKGRNVLILGEKDFDEFAKDDGIVVLDERYGNIKGSYLSHTLSIAENKIKEINSKIKIYETEDLIVPKYVPEDDVDSNEIILKGL